MAETIKGINVIIGAETSGLSKALSDVNKHAKDIQSELRQVDRLLKLDPKNTELLAQKHRLLSDAVENSREKFKRLQQAKAQVDEQFKRGEISPGQYRAFNRELVKSRQELRQFASELARTDNRLGELGVTMQGAGRKLMPLTALILGATAGMGKSAMDLEATEAKYRTVFGEFSDLSDQYIEDFQKLTPATKAEARSMAAGIQDLLVPMGFVREEATKMTGEFMKVAGALANFNSGTETTDSVMTKIQAAITGEYQGLKSLGVQLDATTAKQKAVEMGLAKSTKEVTKQHLAQVILAEIYAQSGDALAAYNEDSLDALTKSKLLAADIKDLAASFGELFLPAITATVDKVRSGVKWLQSLDKDTQKTIVTVGLIAAAIGPVLIVLGTLATKVQAIIHLVKTWQIISAATGVSMGSMVLPILAVVAAIAAVVYAFTHWEEIVTFFSERFQYFKGILMTNLSGIRDGFATVGRTIVNTVSTMGERIKASFTAPIKAAADFIRTQLDKIKSWFSGLKISLPKIKLPHFKLTGSFSIVPPSVPKISVNWYAKGGIFDAPSVVGVGEAGREAVIPLDRLPSLIYEALAKAQTLQSPAAATAGGGDIIIQRMEVRDDHDIIKISRELHKLQQSKSRARGVRI